MRFKKDKSRYAEIRKYLREYNPSLVLGEPLGEGATAQVFDLDGTNPPRVIKILDTRSDTLFDSVDRAKMRADPLFAAQQHKILYRYYVGEINTMLTLQGQAHIMPILGQHECVIDKKSYSSVFLIEMPKLEPLSHYYVSNGLSELDCVQLAIDICLALQACADRNILHRDLKPDNIFVARQGDRISFVLGDFGFCRLLEETGGRVTQVGTRHYQSPEIACARPIFGFNSDLYSLGSTLYFLLSGGNFCDDLPLSLAISLLPDRLSQEFVRIIRKSLERDPRQRYQTADDMRRDLERLRPAGGQLLRNPNFLAAKQALLQGNFLTAMEFAYRGAQAGEDGCHRLLAYCMYHERSESEQFYPTAIMLLDELVFAGDAIAQCLRANIYAQENNWDKFYLHMKGAADEDCVIAQYYYGRALCEGWVNRPRDLQGGLAYLRKAADAEYLPAMKIYKRLYPQAVLKTELSEEVLADANRLKADIVKFL